ncbi:Zinc knuckle [Microdochium nivale]|nr:Zinc knuckle [Microdochium nivale]
MHFSRARMLSLDSGADDQGEGEALEQGEIAPSSVTSRRSAAVHRKTGANTMPLGTRNRFESSSKEEPDGQVVTRSTAVNKHPNDVNDEQEVVDNHSCHTNTSEKLKQQPVGKKTRKKSKSGKKDCPSAGAAKRNESAGAWDFSPSKDVPKGYNCKRCGRPGHWLQQCPTNLDPSYDVPPYRDYRCDICGARGVHFVILCPRNRDPASLTRQRQNMIDRLGADAAYSMLGPHRHARGEFAYRSPEPVRLTPPPRRDSQSRLDKAHEALCGKPRKRAASRSQDDDLCGKRRDIGRLSYADVITLSQDDYAATHDLVRHKLHKADKGRTRMEISADNVTASQLAEGAVKPGSSEPKLPTQTKSVSNSSWQAKIDSLMGRRTPRPGNIHSTKPLTGLADEHRIRSPKQVKIEEVTTSCKSGGDSIEAAAEAEQAPASHCDVKGEWQKQVDTLMGRHKPDLTKLAEKQADDFLEALGREILSNGSEHRLELRLAVSEARDTPVW